MKNNSWKKLSTKVVYRNKWMKVMEDEVIFPSGEKGIFGVVEKDPFVVIIPFVENKIALVKQYRYPIESYSWEFPEGLQERASEDIKEAAKRELHEETGLLAEDLKELGTLWLAPGHNTQQYTVFVTKDCKWGEKDLEESEKDMVTEMFTLEEVKEMIIKGIIKDSPTIASLNLYLLYENN